MQSKIVKDALILLAITMVAGLLLGLVFQITKAPIAKAQEASKMEAYKKLFSDASSFESVDTFNADDVAAYLDSTGKNYNNAVISEVAKAINGSDVIGYVITLTCKGDQGNITYSTGIEIDGTLRGYSITNIAETPGLGMKATESDFSSQFVGKNVANLVSTKAEASSDDQIVAISGATHTTDAIVNSMNAALDYFNASLK